MITGTNMKMHDDITQFNVLIFGNCGTARESFSEALEIKLEDTPATFRETKMDTITKMANSLISTVNGLIDINIYRVHTNGMWIFFNFIFIFIKYFFRRSFEYFHDDR